MFLEIIDPLALPVYRTKDRYKLRILETGAPGRMILNLTFKTKEDAQEWIKAVQEEMEKPNPIMGI